MGWLSVSTVCKERPGHVSVSVCLCASSPKASGSVFFFLLFSSVCCHFIGKSQVLAGGCFLTSVFRVVYHLDNSIIHRKPVQSHQTFGKKFCLFSCFFFSKLKNSAQFSFLQTGSTDESASDGLYISFGHCMQNNTCCRMKRVFYASQW